MVRRMIRKYGIAVLAMGAAGAAALAGEPTKAKLEQDIVYTKAGETELKLDLEQPTDGDGPFPAVVVLHGGAWRQGSKADVRPLLHEFARRGYVAVAPAVPPLPQGPVSRAGARRQSGRPLDQAQCQEIPSSTPSTWERSAFRPVATWRSMLGLTGPQDGLEGDVSAALPDSRVKAVVNYFGPTDLAAKDIPEICKPWVKDFLGGSPADKPEAAAKASPLTFVSSDDAPVLTFQGTNDPLVPFTQAIKLAEAMTNGGRTGPRRADGRRTARLGRRRDGAHGQRDLPILRRPSQDQAGRPETLTARSFSQSRSRSVKHAGLDHGEPE